MFGPKFFAIVLSLFAMFQAGFAAAADKGLSTGAQDATATKSAPVVMAAKPALAGSQSELQPVNQKLKKPKAKMDKRPSTVPELDGALASLSLLLLGGLVALARELKGSTV